MKHTSKLIVSTILLSLASSTFAWSPIEQEPPLHRDHRDYRDNHWQQEREARNQDRQREIDHRIDRTQERINRGIRYGSLNRFEARGLNRELNDIRRDRNHSVRDGRMDRDEFERLSQWLDRLSDKVRFEKHDEDHRRPKPW